MILARKLSDFERNTWYGHDLYIKLTGQIQCECEVCQRLREEIANGTKKIG